jgi:hypothetical protein
MKVTRNKGGYVIRVTNTEWKVLRHIHDEGYMGIAEVHEDGCGSGLEGAEKSIFTQIYNQTRPWMQVTEDRRK